MKTLKIGIFGAGRGADIAANFQLLGCEITAICDFHEERRKNAVKRLGEGITEYTDFDFALCEGYARKINPDLRIFRVSAKTGEGMASWLDWLKQEGK